jgi:two-component system sensor histidine kinase PhoQ
VRVTAATGEPDGEGRRWLTLVVGDDGPGVPAAEAATVLARGHRADARGDVPGQGIGLAVVSEIVGLYGGSIVIGTDALGGAAVEVRLPVA